jgi:hypothetical protein
MIETTTEVVQVLVVMGLMAISCMVTVHMAMVLTVHTAILILTMGEAASGEAPMVMQQVPLVLLAQAIPHIVIGKNGSVLDLVL